MKFIIQNDTVEIPIFIRILTQFPNVTSYHVKSIKLFTKTEKIPHKNHFSVSVEIEFTQRMSFSIKQTLSRLLENASIIL